jgi:pimeloyl-ACP methyl ester carboxylesterase
MILYRLMFIAGTVLILPVSLLATLALFTPITLSGAMYLIGALLIAAGAITAPWRRTRFHGITRAGLVLICLVACSRLVVAARGTTVNLITLPGNHSTRWLDRLVHERDVALFGVQLAYLTRTAISPREHEGLMPALTAAYTAMEKTRETTSSPFLSTYLGRQRPEAFDTVLIEPASGVPASSALVFLHGFTGSFTVQGWLVSQAASRIGAVTVCPSVGWRGDWWTEDGQQTVRNTLDYLHARGVKRVYLAGLSNGAVGTCRSAPCLSSELAGLILISGADPHAPDSGLPVLALQGNADQRMPAALALQMTQRAGKRGTYREFDGDHLLLAKRAHEVQEVLAEWLSQQENDADTGVRATGNPQD